MRQEKRWVVYKHTNIINDKVYIGITSQKPKNRWSNGNGYKGQIKFYNAISKYGWDNFEHEIIFDNLTFDEANEIEIKMIQKYSSNKRGYNVTLGGDGMLGVSPSEETRKRQSNAKIGKYTGVNNANSKSIVCLNHKTIFKIMKDACDYCGASKKHLAEVCNGTANYCGRDPETRELLCWMYYEDYIRMYGDKQLNTYDTVHIDNDKFKVVCLELNKVFNNTAEADKYVNKLGYITHRHISMCCDNKIKTCGKLHWMWYGDYLKLHNETQEFKVVVNI